MKSLNYYLNSDTINEVSYGKGSNAIITDIMQDPVEGLAKELLSVIGKRIWVSSAYRDEYNQARVVYGNWKRKGGANGGRQYLLKLYGNDRLAGKVADAYEAGTSKKDSIAKAEKVLVDAMNNNKEYMSNHQLENAVDISSWQDENGNKRGLNRSEYKKIKDFIKGGSSKYAVKVVDEGDHVHIKLNIKGGAGKRTAKARSKSIKKITFGKGGSVGATAVVGSVTPTDDSNSEISFGSKGADVKEIQQTLVNLGYSLGSYGINQDGVDGHYGKATAAAIKDFQQRNKLTASGSLDTLTYAKIKSSKFKKLKGPKTQGKIKTFFASIFGNGLKLNITPNADGTATAVAENINSYNSLSDYLIEGIADDWIRKQVKKQMDKKKKGSDKKVDIMTSDKGKYGGYKDDALSTAEAGNKATFNINKNTDGSYMLTATNTEAINKIGGNSTTVKDKKDIETLNQGFTIKTPDKTTSPIKGAPYVPGGPSTISHKYSGAQASNIKLLEDAAKKRGVTNPISLVGILSVIGKESRFIPKSEKPYRNTSNSRIRHIFGSKLNVGGKTITDAELNVLKADDKAFFDRVYGGKYGNSSDEGYKYRGRGFNGITFKGNYKKYGGLIGKDLIGNPDLLNDSAVAADAAVAYFTNQFSRKGIDPNSFTNTKDAIQTFAHANAGWGKSPHGTVVIRATTNATKISNNFSIA